MRSASHAIPPAGPLGRPGSEVPAQVPGARADSPHVGPDTHAPAPRAELRCPHCRGAVGPQAQWCTQCWADLRPPPEPAVVTPAEPVVALSPPGLPLAALPAPRPGGLRGWPCSGCGETNAVELTSCAACGTGFLAGLHQDSGPVLALPVVGDLALLSRAQRLGLAGGVVLLAMVLITLLGLLTG